jgi:hypothetical protein
VIGDDGGTKLAMYLNIPTTKLINIRLNGVLSDHTEQVITSTILTYWKMMRETVSDKDLVSIRLSSIDAWILTQLVLINCTIVG